MSKSSHSFTYCIFSMFMGIFYQVKLYTIGNPWYTSFGQFRQSNAANLPELVGGPDIAST
jgi:hypothetical protein